MTALTLTPPLLVVELDQFQLNSLNELKNQLTEMKEKGLVRIV